MTWDDLTSPTGQLAVLIALTALTYKLIILRYPDVPEAVMQFIAAIYGTAATLAVTFSPDVPKYKWLAIGLSAGVLLSQNIIKSIDWASAATKKVFIPGVTRVKDKDDAA